MRWAKGAYKMTEFEMRVSVDQSRQNRHATKINGALDAAIVDPSDAALFDLDDRISQRTAVPGEDDFRLERAMKRSRFGHTGTRIDDSTIPWSPRLTFIGF